MILFFEFIASIALTVFSVGVLLFSLKLGTASTQRFIVGPAIFPGTLAIALIMLSACWLISIIRKNRFGEVVGSIKEIKSMFNGKRVVLFKQTVIIAVSLLYIFVLLPSIGFVYSTMVFLLFSTIYFGRMRLISSAVVSIVFTYTVSFFFSNIMHIPLP